jgi:5'-nucleotidase
LKLLISNDDGIHSEGITTLCDELKKIADVIVVAPDRERSAAAHSLTLHLPLRVKKISKSFYAVDGTPTDSVILGVCAILKKKPDIIVSGINKGPNLGEDITYSGTVAAAIEGTILGIPSFAISLVSNGDSFNFKPAASFAAKLVKLVMKYGLPKSTLLNVNVPDIPGDKIEGSMITRQGKRVYDNTIVEKTDPRGKKYYWMGGDDIGFLNEPGTDFNAIENNHISITPIKIDLTDHDSIKRLNKWEI